MNGWNGWNGWKKWWRFELLLIGLLVIVIATDHLGAGGAWQADFEVVELLAIVGLCVSKYYVHRKEEVRVDLQNGLTVDPLTGLYTHSKMNEKLKQLIFYAEEMRQEVSLLYFDLDDFKPINDNYGHAVGDQVLKHVVRILCEKARETDIVGRYAGDEFLMVLPATDATTADLLAAKLQERLNTIPFRFNQYEEALPISVSIGVANYPNDAQNVKKLLECAMASTEQAKKEGKAKILRVPTYMQVEKYVKDSSRDLEVYILSLKDKDTYTVQHSEDVARYALVLADALSLPPMMKRELRTAGILHDIGKILIPDSILKKPGRLTDEEYQLMKKHVVLSHEILDGHYTSETMKQAIICHHERFDGGGYPIGLTGADIPLAGRIMAIADAFSAMTLDRAYRKSKTTEEGLAEIRRCAGQQFDPKLAEVFCQAIENQRELVHRTLDDLNTA